MRHALALVLVLAPLACEGPNVNVKHVTPVGGTPEDLQLDVELEVVNDHDVDVKVERITANATLAMRFPLEPIVKTFNTWIPANSRKSFHLPVQVPWRELPGIEAIILARGGLDYQVTGVAYLLVTSAAEIAKKSTFKTSGFITRDELFKKLVQLPPVPIFLPSKWPLPTGLPIGFPQ